MCACILGVFADALSHTLEPVLALAFISAENQEGLARRAKDESKLILFAEGGFESVNMAPSQIIEHPVQREATP
jgi:hypothetical protein